MNILKGITPNLTNPTLVRHQLAELNSNEIAHLSGEIYAHLYWKKRNPHWFRDSRKAVAGMHQLERTVIKRLKTGRLCPELSRFGSVLERQHFIMGDSYDFQQTMIRGNQWIVMVQNSYSAVWADHTNLRLCSFTEGDVVYTNSPNETVYRSELNHLYAWIRDDA